MTLKASELIEQYIAAWNRHDVDAILGFFDDDCSYEDEALGKILRGKAELRNFFVVMYQGFPNCAFEVVNVFDAANCIAWEWVMSGNYDGMGNNGIPPNGKPMRVRGTSITELINGKIKRNTDYWNLAGLMRQLGALPEKVS